MPRATNQPQPVRGRRSAVTPQAASDHSSNSSPRMCSAAELPAAPNVLSTCLQFLFYGIEAMRCGLGPKIPKIRSASGRICFYLTSSLVR